MLRKRHSLQRHVTHSLLLRVLLEAEMPNVLPLALVKVPWLRPLAAEGPGEDQCDREAPLMGWILAVIWLSAVCTV